MKENEKLNYLAKKYLDRTITRSEWEELLEKLDRAEKPEEIDEIFRNEWVKDRRNHSVPQVTWKSIQELNEFRGGMNTDQRKKVHMWKWAVAASILVLIAVIWWIQDGEKGFFVYETGNGETKTVILDDGTTVTMNANSRLTWDENWQNSEERFAELEGEAYFDVSHKGTSNGKDQKLLPFRVRTSDLMINVLGTAFNVSSRRGKTDVFLERGKVKLDLFAGNNNKREEKNAGDPEESGSQLDTLTMKPGELISFSSETRMLTKSGDEMANDWADWMDGTLSFRKIEFGIVMNELGDIYGKHFKINDKSLIQRKVFLALPYENWETVKDLIEVTLNLEMIEDEDNLIEIKKRTGK